MKKKVGFQDPSAKTISINGSERIVFIDCGRSRLTKIEVSEKSFSNLHLLIISYLKTPAFTDLSKSRRVTYVQTVRNFFKYLDEMNFDTAPYDCLSGYIQYSKRTRNASEFVIYLQLTILKLIIKWGYEKSDFNDDFKIYFRKIILHTPTLKKPISSPDLPISQIIEDCPYTDTEILNSLVRLCVWIINFEIDYREKLINLDGMPELIKKCKSKDIYNPPISKGVLDKTTPSYLEARKIYGTLVRSILNSDNLVMKERLISEIAHPFDDSVLSVKKMNWILERCLTDRNEIKSKYEDLTFRLKNKKRKYYCTRIFKLSAIASLIVPTDVEVYAMYCLLSAERINGGSILNMVIDDFIETTKGVHFQTRKTRGSVTPTPNVTPLHTNGSSLGRTYKAYIDTLKKAQKHYNKNDKNLITPFQNLRTKLGTIGNTSLLVDTYFKLLITKNSHIRKKLFEAFDSEKESLEPILWIISKLYEVNHEKRIQISEYMKELKKSKRTNIKIKEKDHVTTKGTGLTGTNIRQSSIVSDDKNILQNPNNFYDENVVSQLSSHKTGIHQSVYTDRSTAKEKIESDRLFAARIGELMEKESEKIGTLVSKTSVLDYDEALELLGLPRNNESSRDRLSKEIYKLGIDVDLMDSFKSGGTKVFLENKNTSALIIKYLEHIRENFDNLLNDDNNLTKSTLAARDYFYLSNILQKFPTKIREEGEKHAQNLSFSYANLIDLVGISNV